MMKRNRVSVFYVDQGIDSGPIIFQEKVVIENKSFRRVIIIYQENWNGLYYKICRFNI